MNTMARVTKRKSDENVHDETLQKKTKDIEDIKHIEDLYNTILDIKIKLNAAYQENSLKLKKSFESIQLIVPERTQRLSSPTMPIPEEPKQQKQPSQSPQPSAEPEKPPSLATKPSNLPKGSVAKKWMLKHQEPGPGLIELMPDTGIYVDELELKRTKLTAPDMRKFARALLMVVFSKKALSKCSYTGLGKAKRPGLDQYAKTVFMAYVTKHAEESGWEIVSRQLMTYAMTSKINDLNMRFFDPKNIKNEFLRRFLNERKV